MLDDGWEFTQDVRDLGETLGWYEPEYATPEVLRQYKEIGEAPDLASDWQPLSRLTHLQLLLAPQPYYGRDLRYFNDHSWWYRKEFTIGDAPQGATLRFEGVDYFAKVWVNGHYVGRHEGYADPFEFEVGAFLRAKEKNVVVVEVSSPWDHAYAGPTNVMGSVIRNLQKGSYEHADTFVQRDVNPIGIWRPVSLTFHGALRQGGDPDITSVLSRDQEEATVTLVWPIANSGSSELARYIVRITLDGRVATVASYSRDVRLGAGTNSLAVSLRIKAPKLWTTWDRGTPSLYQASLEIRPSGRPQGALRAVSQFGIRTVELRRTAGETRFILNGRPIFLRGTTYWPDLYLSNMTRERYERDIDNALRAGINAFRVHVHTENPIFYDICDRRGIVVIQDNDLNWVFPSTPQFTARAVTHFASLVKMLRNHPSVIAWVGMNEVYWGEEMFKGVTHNRYTLAEARALAHSLAEVARKTDPTRPVIENSGQSTDLGSGDTHEYRGSLAGGTYFDMAKDPRDALGGAPKLVTEFGMDAPPAAAHLKGIPEVAARLADVLPRAAELQDRQYDLIKYYIEYYRVHKYAPNSGYFQFMWIDFSPQSFYGVYDYWGNPKDLGKGGGIRAMLESNQPIGIFMEHDAKPMALYAVNDTLLNLGECFAHWRVTAAGTVVDEGREPVHVGIDSVVKVRDFSFPVKEGQSYDVTLRLTTRGGRVLAENEYSNPFHADSLSPGYPERIDDELGVRLWWAGAAKQ